jgi:hypothetical protein
METIVKLGVRITMFIALSMQNKTVADIYDTYLGGMGGVQSAVQASQLSGEMALIGMVELSNILVVIVFWVMVELTVHGAYKNSKPKEELN